MSTQLIKGRQTIAESFKLLQKVYRDKPDAQMAYLSVLFDAKADEFANIFTEAFPDEKNRVYTILTEINPSNTNKYKKIKENKN